MSYTSTQIKHNHRIYVCVKGSPENIKRLMEITLWPVLDPQFVTDTVVISIETAYPFNDALLCGAEKIEGLMDIYDVEPVYIWIETLDYVNHTQDWHAINFNSEHIIESDYLANLDHHRRR